MNNKIEFDGQCAFAVSTGKIDVKSGKHTATINCKTYAFSNPIAKILFKMLTDRIKKAKAIWDKNK